MPLDDHARAARLAATPRTDRTVGDRMHRFCLALQTRLVKAMERLEADAGSEARFGTDDWQRPGGGGGTSRVLEGGAVLEKGGVGVSAVWGDLPAPAAAALGAEPAPFFATGLSLVFHPRNPYVPAVHANVRYFAIGADRHRPDRQWFGGGADLTPVYPDAEDARHFHGVLKAVCDDHALADYGAFKAACDAYFFLPHRGETRGIGGIFFDRLGGDDVEAAFLFARSVGRALLPAYQPLVERHQPDAWGERERAFQTWRRGRYAEFNLAYDRGTRFGLETGGRTESILMSLPPVVEWRYDWRPEPGTPEAAAQARFVPTDWLAETQGR